MKIIVTILAIIVGATLAGPIGGIIGFFVGAWGYNIIFIQGKIAQANKRNYSQRTFNKRTFNKRTFVRKVKQCCKNEYGVGEGNVEIILSNPEYSLIPKGSFRFSDDDVTSTAKKISSIADTGDICFFRSF
ncbi:DUF456 domain-containing protein [Vibrio ezurae]|uniref:Uncharacterized protein n=1 Tax=Vibrio ezurae NBRC 102218 TaxID=1219080 RepID=U3AM85_9VIBR|nr:DUF456 domain-containing protein [Vibrio ezurae]GAD81051.1 hypothetical protein VEZ01S_49_00090 [Vibrio ezurae NBRC 102218]